MKSQIFVSIGVLSVAAIGWLVYLDSNRAEVEARQDNVALTGSNASGKPYVAVTQESFVDRIPDPRDKTRTAADIEREFNEEHPLMPSGARGGYGLDRNRKRLESNLGRHLPDELRRKFESLPPDPNDRFRHEIHALRREIRGAIRESASERWRKMIDAVAATGDSNAIEKAFQLIGTMIKDLGEAIIVCETDGIILGTKIIDLAKILSGNVLSIIKIIIEDAVKIFYNRKEITDDCKNTVTHWRAGDYKGSGSAVGDMVGLILDELNEKKN